MHKRYFTKKPIYPAELLERPVYVFIFRTPQGALQKGFYSQFKMPCGTPEQWRNIKLLHRKKGSFGSQLMFFMESAIATACPDYFRGSVDSSVFMAAVGM